MPLSVPEYKPEEIAAAADAFNEWRPCPFPRQALLGWTEASLVLWALTRQVRPDISDGIALTMVRNQYREWIEGSGDYQSIALLSKRAAIH